MTVLSTHQWINANSALARAGGSALHVGYFLAGFFGLSDAVGEALGEELVPALTHARQWVDDARAESHAWNSCSISLATREALQRNLAALP